MADEETVTITKKQYDVLMKIAQAVHYDKGFFPFISSMYGEKDHNNMAEFVSICPAYGCDFSYEYKMINQVKGPDW